jgi:hypothetical protein
MTACPISGSLWSSRSWRSVLKRMSQDTNSLSAVLRQAYDGDTLRTMARNAPLRATGSHISLLAHITERELLTHLTETESVNGFANRFLYLLVRRSKELPNPSPVPAQAVQPLVNDLTAAVAFARAPRILDRDPIAAGHWEAIYSALSAERPDLYGAITARAEVHVLRLSVLYALLDRSPLIQTEHLKAALALWTYADTSARILFGSRTGIQVADTIESALRTSGPLTRTQIWNLFNRNRSKGDLDAALNILETRGRARRRIQETDGRAAEVWEAV